MPQVSTARDESEVAAALLDEIAKLLTELQPRRTPRVALDSDIDRGLGIDSLARVELVVRLEQRFAVRLPAETFAEADTPRDLLRAVLEAQHAPAAARVEHISPVPSSAPATSAPRQAETLPAVLRWHAQTAADRPHIRLLEDGRERRVLSHGELLDAAEGLAVGLQARGIEKGDRVALMLPTGTDYFTGFFAILLCGAVPVPIYPPARASQLAEHLRRHAGILANCGARLLITIPRARPLARLLQARAATLQAVVTTADLPGDAGQFIPPRLAGADIAFLQYTSGSTGSPKGVVLTHADLLASIRAMGRAIDAGPDDVFVSWLPLYHDMGLIGAWLGSLYYGIPLVIMSPLDFLARPLSWLEAIQRYRGTISASPNFGYELCMKRIGDAQRATLDLGSWRAAFNGAEPVSPLTVERFIEQFAASGFRAEASMPVYGLAEATLGLAFPPLGRRPLIDRVDREALSRHGEARPAAADDAGALRFPSCGRVLEGYRLRIVDRRGAQLPERRQGRIEFQGPSATSGYFENPEATAQLFDGDWLDTGDLGYLADGEIYLTGRRKDLIVRAGRNLYPQELEDAVGEIPGIRKGCVVAFGSRDPDSGTERLVVLAETQEGDEARREELRQRIVEASADLIGAPPEVVQLVQPHAVLKTSSGKIRRSANREAFEQGQTSGGGPGLAVLVLSGLPALLRRLAGRAGGYLFAAWAWAVFWMLAPLTWIGVVLLPRRRWRFALARGMARALALFTATPLEVQGRERLPPRSRACVVVANHASYLDGALLVAALPRELSFVAKEALAPQFIAGTFLRRIGAEFVERFDARRGLADLKRIGRLGEDGAAVVFFAEGTFSAAPGLRPFHMGAFVTAMEAGLPVVPVAIAGSRSMLRSGSWFPHRGRLSVAIGEPLAPPPSSSEPGENWRAALKLRDRARAHISAHCGEADLAADGR
jgi:1-acyl-sn-glycerol-3-phosphate acyltransferase